MDRERQAEPRPQSWRDRTRSEGGAPADGPEVEPAPHAKEHGPVEHETRSVDHETRVDRDGEVEVRETVQHREVERRDGVDRRVRDERVEEDRRVEARREQDRLARERRQNAIHRVTLGVDYAFYLLYGLLAVRFVLSLLGAAETAGFVQFIQGITNPFYAPFSGIVASPAVNGGILDFPLIIALLAYVLLHVAVRGLLRLLAGDRVAP